MRLTKSVGLFVLVVASAGCGDADTGEASSREPEVGQIAERLESIWDRQPAGVVAVMRDPRDRNPDTSQLWVFACSSTNQLMRRIKTNFRSNTFEGDWTVEADTPCATVPSVSAWSRSPQDQVEVVFRSTSNQLIEVFYDSNGARSELNLSDYLNFGAIAGAPVIADMDDALGNLSVVVRNPSNRLYTLSVFSNRWHVYPVTNASGGGPVLADGTLVGWYSDTKAYLSATDNGTYRTYRHPAWNTGFRQFNAALPSNLNLGVVTFAPRGSQVIAVARDATGRLFYSPTNAAWNFIPVPSNPIRTSTTVYLGAPYSYFYGNNTTNGALAYCRMANQAASAEFDAFELLSSGNQPETIGVTMYSADSMVVNPASLYWNDVFYADEQQNLHWFSYDDGDAYLGLKVRF